MSRISLRLVLVGFVSVVGMLFIIAWSVSIFGSFALAWTPHAKAEVSCVLVRGRLEVAYADGGTNRRPYFSGEWLGGPRKPADVFGAFSCDRFDDPWLFPSGGTVTVFNFPIPALITIVGIHIFVICRRFRLTLAAGFVLVALIAILLAVYAHPYRAEHFPSIPGLLGSDASFRAEST